MAEFSTNTDLSTQFAANSRIWPEPLNSGGQTLAQWLADGGTNTEANFTPVRASAGGRLTSDGDSILFGNVAGNTPRSNIAVTANLAALRIIEDAGSGNSFFGDRWNGTGSGSGTGNSITITNSQIHGSSTGGNFNNSITDVTLTNVEWFQAGTATSFIGNWGAGGSPTSTWTLNGLRCFGETETRIARLGILLGNTTDQSVFNNVDFYDGVPANPRGAYLETFVLQTWENTRLGPLGREFNLTGNRIDGGGGPGDDRLLARFSVRSTGQGSGAGTTPLLGWDWRDVSMVDDVNFVIGIDTQADNLVGGMVFVNPLIGRPGGTGEMIVRNIRGTTGAVDLTVPYLMATRPVTTDTGNPFHRYVPVESTRNVMAFPAQFTNQTIFANQNNGVIDNPANGLLFEVRTDNITAGQTTTDTTGQLFPAYGAMQYRKYSWQQQPDNTTFGEIQTITPPAEGATDEQVTASRGTGYSAIAGGTLTTLTNVDDAEDTIITGLNISYAQGQALSTQNGITNYDQIIAGLKAFTIGRQARGAHEELPYGYAGTTLTFIDSVSFSPSRTAIDRPSATQYRLPTTATLAIGTINTLVAGAGASINFGDSVTPAAGTTLGGSIQGLATTVPQVTLLAGTTLEFPGITTLDFQNITFPATGNVTVDTGGNVDIGGVPQDTRSRVVGASGTTITFVDAAVTNTLNIDTSVAGSFAIRQVVGGSDTEVRSIASFAAGATQESLNLPSFSSSEFGAGDQIVVYVKYTSDLSTRTYYQEGVQTFNFNTAMNAVHQVNIPVPVASALVGSAVTAVPSNFAIDSSVYTTGASGDLAPANNTALVTISNSSGDTALDITQTSGLPVAAAVANTPAYFQSWYTNRGVRTTPIAEFAQNAIVNWDVSRITFASGDVSNNFRVQHVIRNWGGVESGSFALARTGAGEVSPQISGAASIGTVIAAIDGSNVGVQVGDMHNYLGNTAGNPILTSPQGGFDRTDSAANYGQNIERT